MFNFFKEKGLIGLNRVLLESNAVIQLIKIMCLIILLWVYEFIVIKGILLFNTGLTQNFKHIKTLYVITKD